jgi:hypothetical protein
MELLSPKYANVIQFRCVSGMPFSIKARVTHSNTGCVCTRFAPRREAFPRASIAFRQWAFERFNKLNGVANVAVHLHDHLDVGVLDRVQ